MLHQHQTLLPDSFFFLVIYLHSCFVPHWQELVMFGPERPVMSESTFFCFPSHGKAERLTSNPIFCIAFSCTFGRQRVWKVLPAALHEPHLKPLHVEKSKPHCDKEPASMRQSGRRQCEQEVCCFFKREVKTRCTEVWVNSTAADEMAPPSMRAPPHPWVISCIVCFLHTHKSCWCPSSRHSSSQTSHRKT